MQRLDDAKAPAQVTYYSLANARFFPGTVALLNSLRLLGNDEELVLIDTGLSDEQRRRLEPHVRVEPAPRSAVEHPTLLKPAVHELHRQGVAVLIDSDIIVCGPLADIAAQAGQERICAFPDHPGGPQRMFHEWVDLFGLQAPVRPRTYVNAGFLAIGGELARRLLPRWSQVTERLLDRPWKPDPRDPAWDLDQDSLNALLMSEVAPDEIVDLPYGMAMPPAIFQARIVDRSTLATSLDGRALRLLHYTGAPKPWQAGGWARSRRDPYTELLPRLLFADDVRLRLHPREVPLWLRPTKTGAASLSALNVAHRGNRAVAARLPRGVQRRLRRLRSRIARS